MRPKTQIQMNIYNPYLDGSVVSQLGRRLENEVGEGLEVPALAEPQRRHEMPLGVRRPEAADLRAAVGEASSTDPAAAARLVPPGQRRVQEGAEVSGEERLAEINAGISLS